MTEREVHDSVAANVAKWTKQNAAYTDGRAPAARRPADLPHEFGTCVPLLARRGEDRRPPRSRPVRHVPHHVAWRGGRRVPPLARRLDRAPARERFRGRGAA